jgi:hypothetical protein
MDRKENIKRLKALMEQSALDKVAKEEAMRIEAEEAAKKKKKKEEPKVEPKQEVEVPKAE